MKLTEVVSSNVKAIGYDSGTLYVMFNGGSVYAYKDVPPVIYESVMKADSKGRFVSQNIVKYFKYEKLPNCFEFEIEPISKN